jgi:hypothetical protein
MLVFFPRRARKFGKLQTEKRRFFLLNLYMPLCYHKNDHFNDYV